MVKIAFALPVPNSKIIGGYKMVYEYANYIARQGYDVSVIYNAHGGDNSIKVPRILVYLIRLYIGKTGPAWFRLDKRIHKIVHYNYGAHSFDGFDIVVATATETAEYVALAPGKKFYFVQDYENWGRTSEEVDRTFNLDFDIITISKWLQQKIETVSDKKTVYIPNGINRKVFSESIPYERRQAHSVAMLYHDDPRKGCDVAMKVLYRLHEKYNDFNAFLFGSPKKDENWPSLIHYISKASAREVSGMMNSARVFLCTSRQEGFGLTGLESIFCGCVLVTTDCYGIREYASEENAYLCVIDDTEQIFQSVCRAFEEENENLSKRRKCKNVIAKFDAARSRKKFMSTLLSDS